ncbi:MAG TPA: aminotransferase class I/II-fold pyridoxal phosphate-dependent enzyme [Clostridia bacterium]
MSRLIDESRQKKLDFILNLKKNKEYPLFLTMNSKNTAHIVAEGRECINFISNNYLGFSVHPKVAEAVKAGIDRYGVGMAGSPVMSGITDIYNELCEKVASIYQQEAAAVFPSGFQGMLGIIQATIATGDLALLDSLAHRSLIDGVVLSGANRFMWKHNNMESLDKMLSSNHDTYRRKLIIVDSVYSMDGDIACLPEINSVREKYGAFLMVDEAHSLGVIGEHGYGLLDHFRLPGNAVDVVSGVFSKYGALMGGFIAGDKDFVELVKYTSSAYLFTTALPPHICAGVLQTLKLIEEEPEWRIRLWENIKFFTTSLRSLGFDLGNTGAAVVPLYIRDTEKTLLFSKMILERGVIASPVYHPGVAKGEERIRMGLMALHTREDLEKAIEVLKNVGKELGVI